MEDEKQEIMPVQPLQINRTGRRVILKNLMVKSVGAHSRRVVGSLEAHVNGFRYQAARIDPIEIIYNNIKHAFFQPCDREMQVIIQFHLKSPILVNKKKTADIQFFIETGSQTDDLDQRRSRSSYDPDEIAEEQRERDLKKRLNTQFKRFVEGAEEAARLEFEIPYRDLAFKGVPKNSQLELYPTANCLVHLTEWPPFILSLDTIEIVCFERVSHGLRSFDIVFVNKDYSKPVRLVSNVNIEALDTLKKWLNEMDIVWYEVKPNLNWDHILKTIRADISRFVEDGGFECFLGDGDQKGLSSGSPGKGQVHDDEEEESADDDEYQEEDSDEEEYSEEDEDSEEESLDEESSADGFRDVSSGDEEGLSWDELEKEAKRDDRKRGYDGDDTKEQATLKRKKVRK